MSPRPRCSLGPCVVALGLSAWMALASAGFLALEAYERTPGAGGDPPAGWPGGTSLGHVPGVPNVLMAVHPRCPCSRAGLESLAEIVRRSPSPASVRILVYRPEGAGPGWAGASLARAMAEIPGATRVDDPGGSEASRFGLMTSGAVSAFDKEGRPVFSGGLNEARGRPGRSAGGEAVMALLEGRAPGLASAPVFGCGLTRLRAGSGARGALP